MMPETSKLHSPESESDTLSQVTSLERGNLHTSPFHSSGTTYEMPCTCRGQWFTSVTDSGFQRADT
eukprot:378653-Pelagomonas_calceolata.AAC.1